MHIKVLGCSGGIASNTQTTSFLLGNDTLIDAGSGVFSLSLQEQHRIEQIFITHAHFDHVLALPFLMENVARYRLQNQLPPIKLYASQKTIDDIQKYLFNGYVWPDFTALPNRQNPTMQFVPLEVGETASLAQNLTVEAISAIHTVPTQGYAVHHHNDTWIYTGDTTSNPLLWQYINHLPKRGQRLRWLVTETTFANAKQSLADLSQHFTVHALTEDLTAHLLHENFELHLTHLKPSEREEILQELEPLEAIMQAKNGTLHVVEQGQIFTIELKQITQNTVALHAA